MSASKLVMATPRYWLFPRDLINCWTTSGMAMGHYSPWQENSVLVDRRFGSKIFLKLLKKRRRF
ncbi:MAG TPA: hypothetical protein VKM55_23225 [Candidatus Lokiarchaeia archaeon]|nr:hypothetical protein [Candidatus Lokiarchaeia archaeon]